MSKGYEGKIKNNGSQKVEAPMQNASKKSNGSVKKGNDLRNGK